MNRFLVLLQDSTATASKAPAGSIWESIFMFGLIGIVFYMFLIRPQMKRNKESRKFRESLQAGDKIITAGGIHGKILEVNDTTVLINSEGTKLRLEKSSIVMNPEDQIANKTK